MADAVQQPTAPPEATPSADATPVDLLALQQGTDAEAVPSQDETPLLVIPQGNRELAGEVGEHAFAVVLPEIQTGHHPPDRE